MQGTTPISTPTTPAALSFREWWRWRMWRRATCWPTAGGVLYHWQLDPALPAALAAACVGWLGVRDPSSSCTAGESGEPAPFHPGRSCPSLPFPCLSPTATVAPSSTALSNPPCSTCQRLPPPILHLPRSNFGGRSVDLAAPGTDILSTWTAPDYNGANFSMLTGEGSSDQSLMSKHGAQVAWRGVAWQRAWAAPTACGLHPQHAQLLCPRAFQRLVVAFCWLL